ncbi:hypothetical protein AADZ86_03345 [Colwelliaceae bacterium BS250]
MKIFNYALLPLALMTSSATTIAANVDFSTLQQQMTIMSDILKTAANKSTNKHAPKIVSIDSYYLAGQGVVFNLESSRSARHFMGDMPVMPVRAIRAPRAPKGVETTELFGEDFEIIIEEALNEAQIAMEIAHDNMNEGLEDQRHLREQERDLAYELRDVEREQRDLNFEKRHIEESEQVEYDQQLANLEKRRDALDKAMASLAKSNAEHQKKIEQAKAEQAKQKQTFYRNLEVSISDVLCSYGGGLKAIPSDEYVSLVIKNAGDKQGRRTKDKVLVFSKADIKSCIVEKINAKQLLTKANGYQF